jgi:hypothetical protein
MRSRNGTGDSNRPGESHTIDVIEGNAYLPRGSGESQGGEQAGQENEHETYDSSDDEAAPMESADRGKVKQRRRRLTLAAMAVLLVVLLILVTALFYRSSTRVDYGQKTRQQAAVPPAPSASATTGRDTRTEQAIEEAQRITGGTTSAPPTTASSPAPSRETSVTPAAKLGTPFSVPAGFGGTVKPTETDTRTSTDTARTSGRGEAGSSMQGSTSTNAVLRSQRSQESSLYMVPSALEATAQSPPSNAGARARLESKTLRVRERNAEPKVTLPSFGSMLPVRTVGALYTLRNGAFARLELTRDVAGNGWSMKQGTILVGSNKGSDYDRAYVHIMGFIDRRSGKLVKLGGDVLGGDGGAGLKGRRRPLKSGWARALGRAGTAALDMTGAILGGRGRNTVVLSDGMRTRAIHPVTDELSGVIGGELDRKQGQGFVEVAAGTPGYVMVTDLPATLKGVEASPDLDAEDLARFMDLDAARPATGLSERELAELMATGTLEEIKAALPRMSPEMRKIAQLVLGQ